MIGLWVFCFYEQIYLLIDFCMGYYQEVKELIGGGVWRGRVVYEGFVLEGYVLFFVFLSEKSSFEFFGFRYQGILFFYICIVMVLDNYQARFLEVGIEINFYFLKLFFLSICYSKVENKNI